MSYRILAQRASHVVASGLSVVAQRLPFIKGIAPLLGTSSSYQLAAPLVVSIVGIDSLSGASPFVTTTQGSTNPATTNVGENFIWFFRTVNRTAKSFSVTGLPAGLTYTFGTQVSFISGVPTEGGTHAIEIVGWEDRNLRGDKTPTYTFNLTINAPTSPLQTWTEFFWTGSDLMNESVSGPNADPDGDGIENLMEFVLNLDPTDRGAFPGEMATDPNDNTKLIYTLPLNPDGAEMIRFQQSTTLKENDWTDLVPGVDGIEVLTSAGTITLKMPLSAGPRKHIRLVAAIPG